MVKKLILTFSLLALSIIELYARAGGRGGGSWNFLFRTPFGWTILLIFGIVAFLLIRLRIARTRKRLTRFAELDIAWDFKKLERTVEQTYFKVQKAWNDDNLKPVEYLLTEKMLKKLRFQLDYYKSINKKNVLEKIELNSVNIISANDSEDDSKDTFKAAIIGSMIDYDLNLKTGRKIGNNWYSKSFAETWTFLRNGDDWLLDEIKD
jgi:hypothetical protein